MLSYFDFVFIKDERGLFKLVDCSKNPHYKWKKRNDWINENKNDKIVVFIYQSKVMGDTCLFALAFTTKENFANRFNEKFDFDKICKLGVDFTDFKEVQKYLCGEFGYKKENIFEENNDVNHKYKLGLFNF